MEAASPAVVGGYIANSPACGSQILPGNPE